MRNTQVYQKQARLNNGTNPEKTPVSSRDRNFLTSMFAVVGMVAWGIWIVSSLSGNSNWSGLEVVLTMVLLLLTIAPALISALTRRFSIFEPVHIISIAFLLTYVIGTTLYVDSGVIRRNGIELRTAVTPSLIAAIVGLLGFYVGYGLIRMRHVFGHRLASVPRKQAASAPARVHAGYTFGVTLAALGLTVIILQLWASLAGLPLSALNALAEDSYGYNVYAQVTETSSLYLFMFIYSWSGLIALAYIVAPTRFWRLVALLLYIGAGIVYVLMGGRGGAVSHIGGLILLLYLRSGKEPSFRTIGMAVTILSFLVGALVLFRVPYAGYTQSADSDVVTSVGDELRKELMERGTLVGTMQVTLLFPEIREYLGWETVEVVAVNLIPRVLWPDKPANPRPVHNAVQPFARDYHQLPAYDWIAYYYAGFGPLGSFLGLLGLGLLSGWFYKSWKSDPHNPIKQVVLTMWLPSLYVVFHRGDLVFLLIEIAFSYLPVIAVWIFTTRLVLSERSKYKPVTELPA